ncbi:MAG: dual specificity protein phosphatase family protein [Flavobacteriia bacterium]
MKLICTSSFIFLLFFVGFSQKLDSISNGKGHFFENLHRINDSMFRSEQPSKIGILEIQKLGVKSVLSLRNVKSDRFIKRNSSLKFYKKTINAWTMTEDELIEALKLLRDAEKPVLIHCVHGSDRTGTIVAAFRIVFEHWSKEKAIQEMLETQYGFHANFDNLITLLQKLDVERVKTELKLI